MQRPRLDFLTAKLLLLPAAAHSEEQAEAAEQRDCRAGLGHYDEFASAELCCSVGACGETCGIQEADERNLP